MPCNNVGQSENVVRKDKGQKVKGRFRDKLKETWSCERDEDRGYRKQALAKVTELGGEEGVGGRGVVQKGDGGGKEGASCPAVTVPPPPGVGVPGDAAGAAPRRVLPQDLAFPPAPAPGRPESGPAVAARGP